MKRFTMLGSLVVLVGGWQIVMAQPPGGGGGRGGFGMDFDALNTETEESPDHLTVDEVSGFFEEIFANRGGGPGGRGGGGQGDGNFAETIFGNWDADDDGMVTREEFENRPQVGGRGGGGGGGPGGQGGPGGPGADGPDGDAEDAENAEE